MRPREGDRSDWLLEELDRAEREYRELPECARPVVVPRERAGFTEVPDKEGGEGMSAVAKAQCRRDFWALLVRQAEHAVKRAEVCRGWDPVSRKTTEDLLAELALTRAASPALREVQGGGG